MKFMSDNAIFNAAIKIASEAIELDRAKKYDLAADKYIQACETLNDFAKFCKNSKLKSLAEQKAIEYFRRADAITQMKKKKIKKYIKKEMDSRLKKELKQEIKKHIKDYKKKERAEKKSKKK